MLTKNIIPLFAALLLLAQTTKAQIPVNDGAWQLQTGRSDDFNSGSLDPNKWWTGGPSPVYWAANVDYTSNVILTGTTLKLKTDTLVPNYYPVSSQGSGWWCSPHPCDVTYVYQGGGIQSTGVPNGYKFGYLEINAKYPTGKYSDWPAFWLYWYDCTSPKYYNEIDIAENGGWNSKDGHKMGTNVHMGNSGSCGNDTNDPFDITNLPLLSSAFHKYAIEWAPDRIIWYFDDVAKRILYDASGVNIPQNPLRLVLNFAIDPWNSRYPSDWNNMFNYPNPSYAYDTTGTNFPHYFEIDYVNYYKLVTDCNTALTNLCVPGDYDRKVKKSITTNNTCSPNFNPSTASGSYTLRATDYVLLDVPSGTNSITINPTGTGYFAIDVIACPQ